MNITGLKDIMQDCNINFLLGSGLSTPYLSTLGKIEGLLTELAKKDMPSEKEEIIRASLYKKFFDDVISKNIEILNNSNNNDVKPVLDNYCLFLKTLNFILLKRKSTILNKQINLFTTNIDIFLEKSLEERKVEYNDGFSGRFDPLFDLTNFKKSLFKTSLHHDNIFELPVFNLMKIHGSLTWNKRKNGSIGFSSNLSIIKRIRQLEESANGKFIDINDLKSITIKDLIAKAKGVPDASINKFIKEYEKLAIINPTKEKFQETILNMNHYELLRIFSNELEKENTVLFVAGFSFADEHIREVTIRAANSNPTLAIYIFSHSNKIDKGMKEVEEKSKNHNVKICSPAQKDTVYTFEDINKLFGDLQKNISDADTEVNRIPNHHE